MWRRFVALGDSFTEGLDDPGPDGRHRGWADRVAEQLAAIDPEVTYANLAVRGRLLPQVVAEQVPRAIALEPDLVSLGAGVNDAMRRHWDLPMLAGVLESGVVALRSTGADVLLFAFGDPSRSAPRLMAAMAARIRAYDDVVLDVAERHGCRVVDFWGLAAFDDPRFWAADRLHLNAEGHERAAGAALEALGLGDDRWRTPPAMGPAPSSVERAWDVGGWAAAHLGPWLYRRVRGVSSGDGVAPERPDLAPVDRASIDV